MGKFKYRRLCDINFQHAYFENGYAARPVVNPVSDLLILPSVETSRLFQTHALRIHSSRSNSVSVYGEVEQDAVGKERLVKPLPDSGKLVLVVTEQNPDYQLLSDAPLHIKPSMCLYLTNATGDNTATLEELHLMQSKNQVDWQNDLVTLHQTGTYNFVHNGALNAADVLLKLRNSVTTLAPAKLIQSGSNTQVVFDLKQAADGMYTLAFNGNEAGSFYYLKNVPYNGTPLAIVELYWSRPATDNYLWQNDDKSLRNAPSIYVVRFAARQSVWKYQIDFKYRHRPENLPGGTMHHMISDLKVTSNNREEKFQQESETDNRLFSIVSQQPLDWRENSERIITLNYNVDNASQDPVGPLPHPVPAALRTDPQTQQLISPISLHL
ncbi:MAG: hypothetical protein KDC61_15355 [Saprospiraceae bacterium]|nr:hypothetical protein [Saprospiraceae bacterium]